MLNLYGSADDACDDFLPNRAWMKRSGNMCWGMGAANRIPCLNCGATSWAHESKRLDAEIENLRRDRPQTRED